MSSRTTDDRGQILSSYAALGAVIAIVAGLVVLIATRGDESAAGPQPPAPSTSQPTVPATSAPKSSAPVITPAPSPKPSPKPSLTPTPTVTPPRTPTRPPATTPTTTQTAPPASPTTQRPTSTATEIPAANLPAVEVYNNTRRRGLAEQVADKARAVGWTVAGADNWRGKVVASTVYYPAGMQDAAVQLAQVLGISRTKDALPNMKKDRLSVILTSDYSG